ncbi:MAG: OmpA family protein [Bacteroidia bacterium]
MSKRTLLVLLSLLAIILLILFTRWWSCCIQEECGQKEKLNEAAVTPPPPVQQDPRLAFNWTDAAAVTGPGFEAYRDSLLGLVAEGKVLRIEGKYYPGEAAPEGYANMGLARAASIAALFKPPLNDDQIELSSKLIEPAPNPVPAGLFASQIISIGDAEQAVALEATEEEVIIYFPTGSKDRIKAADVEAAIDRLVESQKRTGRSVSVTGHTDSQSSAEFNLGLSQRRAREVRQILINKGVAAAKVSASGLGENQPKASNDNEAGKARNRRVEVKLLP